MPRRSTPQKTLDDTAFPVRVKIRVPPNGLGMLLDDCFRWLNVNVGHQRYSHASTTALGGNATAFYFVEVNDAMRFVDAFPMLKLADGTQAPSYGSPVNRKVN